MAIFLSNVALASTTIFFCASAEQVLFLILLIARGKQITGTTDIYNITPFPNIKSELLATILSFVIGLGIFIISCFLLAQLNTMKAASDYLNTAPTMATLLATSIGGVAYLIISDNLKQIFYNRFLQKNKKASESWLPKLIVFCFLFKHNIYPKT